MVESRALLMVFAALASSLSSACHEDESAEDHGPCLSPGRLVGESCVAPGVQDNGCPAGTSFLDDGSCRPAGVPPELCAEGFSGDGNMGCQPVLPAAVCPKGQMAVMGESACHAVSPCGSGKWGDIPIDATTIYVDGSYAGLDSDGSSAKPWKTISEAVEQAAPGALIAVTAGRYVENVVVRAPIRLWGVCPEQVEIVGTTSHWFTLAFVEGSDGAEVHGIALTGDAAGLGVSGANDVLIENVWVHDCAYRGLSFEVPLGPTSVAVRRSLSEGNEAVGVIVTGADVTLDDVVVRGTLPDAVSELGIGVYIDADVALRGRAHLRRSLIDGNHTVGVYVSASDVAMEGTVVRNTKSQATDATMGIGLMAESIGAERSSVVVSGSVFEGNRSSGLSVVGSELTMDAVVVRGTLPRESDLRGGRGIELGDADGLTPAASIRSSLFEKNYDTGILGIASDLDLEGVLVRETLPRAVDQMIGAGVTLQMKCGPQGCSQTIPPRIHVRGSVIELSHTVGVYILASDAVLDAVLIRDIQPQAGDGVLGDGLSINSAANTLGFVAHASAVVTNSSFERSSRIGLSNFGGTVALGSSAFVCNRLDLGVEDAPIPAAYDDLGDNGCGCGSLAPDCRAESSGLAPPDPFTVPE